MLLTNIKKKEKNTLLTPELDYAILHYLNTPIYHGSKLNKNVTDGLLLFPKLTRQ